MITPKIKEIQNREKCTIILIKDSYFSQLVWPLDLTFSLYIVNFDRSPLFPLLLGSLKLPFGSFPLVIRKSFFGRNLFLLNLPFSRKGVRKTFVSIFAKQPLKKDEAFLDKRVIDAFWPEARKLLWKASCYHLEKWQGRIPLLQELPL